MGLGKGHLDPDSSKALGFTVGQIDAIRDEGYTDFEDFMDVSPEHLRKICQSLLTQEAE